eukprot:108057_1
MEANQNNNRNKRPRDTDSDSDAPDNKKHKSKEPDNKKGEIAELSDLTDIEEEDVNEHATFIADGVVLATKLYKTKETTISILTNLSLKNSYQHILNITRLQENVEVKTYQNALINETTNMEECSMILEPKSLSATLEHALLMLLPLTLKYKRPKSAEVCLFNQPLSQCNWIKPYDSKHYSKEISEVITEMFVKSCGVSTKANSLVKNKMISLRSKFRKPVLSYLSNVSIEQVQIAVERKSGVKKYDENDFLEDADKYLVKELRNAFQTKKDGDEWYDMRMQRVRTRVMVAIYMNLLLAKNNIFYAKTQKNKQEEQILDID